MRNKKKKSKESRMKIRIRSVDLNIPDSNVCEVFDSSLENEEESSRNYEPSLGNKGNLSKPKNYFDLLMPKKQTKGGSNNSSKNIEVLTVSDDEESSGEKQSKLSHFVYAKRKDIKYKTDSSEDESILKVQTKLKVSDVEGESQSNIEVTEEESKDLYRIFDSPKVNLSDEKKLSILNYFKKSENSLENKIGSEKLEEITCVVNSLKMCQAVDCTKLAKNEDLVKQCQIENKISLNDINKENVKLAPLFCKKVNEVIDSERQKARLDFLYRGLPLVFKKTENKTAESVPNFPTVSHVQQRDDSACWSQREVCLPVHEVLDSQNWSAVETSKKFSLKISDSSFVNNSIATYSVKIDEEFLSRAKCKYSELNLDLVIDGLKEKWDKFLTRTKDISLEKSKISNSRKCLSDGTGFEELNTLWIEKYRPTSSEILDNGSVVKKLKKWLNSWKSFDEELKVLAKSSRGLGNQIESDGSSSNDFGDSESDYYGLKIPGNVCIISGPNSCGKTALVYALANELEFTVLELNATSKRTGKKVLSDLQEATQSHKVHRLNFTHTDVAQKEPEKKRNKRRKKSKKCEKYVKISDQANDCKISLILIEDADIVFSGHDEGFFSAIASLVQTSKRPLIFLTNEPNCHHLYGFKTEQCLILKMELPSFYKSCAVLDIVSSLEGATFDKEILASIVRRNNFDLRKSLLQLQFWMHSGQNPVALQKQFDLGYLWLGLSEFLFNQTLKHYLKPRGLKRKRHNDLFDSTDEEMEITTKKFKPSRDDSVHFSVPNKEVVPKKPDTSIETYFEVLDIASTLDCLCLSGSHEPILGFEFKPKDSLSLNENMEESPWIRRTLTEEISNELVSLSTRIFNKNLKDENRELNFIPPCWEEIRWRNSQEKASEELSMLVPPSIKQDKRSLHVDYLPILRNICRAERNRSELNPRRGNRFYHYLNSLGLELTEENLEINCNVFCE